MDVTPLIPAGRQIIEAYGDGGFRITGSRYEGSRIVFADRVVDWAPDTIEQVDRAALEPLLLAAERIDVLLLGCGPRQVFLEPDLRKVLRQAGIAVETMDTGSACRTYNVLMAEERRVAAALIAV